MKKWTLYLCAGILALGLAGCGKDSREPGQAESSSSPSQSSEVPSQSEESSTETQEESTGEAAEGVSEEMAGLRAAVVAAVGEEEYWPDMQMAPDMLEAFYGISADLYEDYLAESPMISANVDTLVIVRPKEGQADAVRAALEAYREANVGDTMQYPQNLGKIQASQVEQIGDYVVFVQLGGSAIDLEKEEDALAKCQEANQLALDAIRGKVGGN